MARKGIRDQIGDLVVRLSTEGVESFGVFGSCHNEDTDMVGSVKGIEFLGDHSWISKEFYKNIKDHKARKVQTTALQIWPAFTSGFGRNAASDYRVIEMDLPDFGMVVPSSSLVTAWSISNTRSLILSLIKDLIAQEGECFILMSFQLSMKVLGSTAGVRGMENSFTFIKQKFREFLVSKRSDAFTGAKTSIKTPPSTTISPETGVKTPETVAVKPFTASTSVYEHKNSAPVHSAKIKQEVKAPELVVKTEVISVTTAAKGQPTVKTATKASVLTKGSKLPKSSKHSTTSPRSTGAPSTVLFKGSKVSKPSTSSEKATKLFKTGHKKPLQDGPATKKPKLKAGLSTYTETSVRVGYVKNKFECVVCEEAFELHETLLYHYLKHTSKKFYKCSYCNKEFKSDDSLKKHSKNFHPYALYSSQRIGYDELEKLERELTIEYGKDP